MALSVLDDRSRPPRPDDLAAALGTSHELWEHLTARVAEAHPPIAATWHFAGAKYGWSLRLVRGNRVVLYLIPQAGHFLVGVVLGEKACRAARQAGLPDAVLALLDAARPYAEGRGIRVPVRATGDLPAILKLAALKLSA